MLQPNYSNTYFNQDYVFKHIKDYFDIDEWFDMPTINHMRHVYPRDYKTRLWALLDFRLLSNMLYIRTELDKSITINIPNNTNMDERGVRVNLSDMSKSKTLKGRYFLSAHVFAMGCDFNVYGMTAEKTRKWIEEQGEKIPFKCRLEWKMKGKPITWVHMDVEYFPNHQHIYKFNA